MIDSLPLTRLPDAGARLTVADFAVLVLDAAGAVAVGAGAVFCAVVEQAASAQAAAVASRVWRQDRRMADS